MDIIAKAPPAANIEINSDNIHLFRTPGGNVCFLEIPASSGLDLTLLTITATGTTIPSQPGELQVGLFAWVKQPHIDPPVADDPDWIMLGASPLDHIGADTDHNQNSWMVQGVDLMYNLGNGKMQGAFQCNVADSPVFPVNLSTNPEGIRGDVSPVMYFAVGAKFTPDTDDGSTPVLTMRSLTLS